MSESLQKHFIAAEIDALSKLSNKPCDSFRPIIVVQSTAFAGPGSQDVLTFTPQENSVWIVTAIDIKVLVNVPADFTNNDWRSTFDLNPYAGGSVGTIQIFKNGQAVTPLAPDIGIMNAGVIFVFKGGEVVTIQANPNQPAMEALTLVTRACGYLAPSEVGPCLTPFQSQIVVI